MTRAAGERMGTRADLAKARAAYREAFATARERDLGDRLLVADVAAFDETKAALERSFLKAASVLGCEAEAMALREALLQLEGAIARRLPVGPEVDAVDDAFDALAAAADRAWATLEAAAPERR